MLAVADAWFEETLPECGGSPKSNLRDSTSLLVYRPKFSKVLPWKVVEVATTWVVAFRELAFFR